MAFPGRASAPPLLTRVHAVTDVNDHMRQIELVGPDVPGLRVRPGAHLVVRVPAGAGTARRVYSIWAHEPQAARLTIRVAAYVAGESDTCRLVQRHLVEQRGWPRGAIRLQPQWAAGRPGFGAGGDRG